MLISIRNGAGQFFDLLTGVILTVYFMLEGEHAYAWFLSFFPPSNRSPARPRAEPRGIEDGKVAARPGLAHADSWDW